MNRPLFALAWLFVGGTAAYDAYFAWEYRAVLAVWEMNPLAVWAAEAYGLGMVLGFKFTSLVFALSMAVYCRWRHLRLERPLTLIVTGAYGLLLLHYSISYLQPAHPTLPDTSAGSLHAELR